METNQELINGAREFASRSPLGRPQARELDKAIGMIRRLADALEAATTETQWEFGTAHRDDPSVGALEWSQSAAEIRAAAWNRSTGALDGFVVKRRAAGPWLPVEGENA